MLRCSQSGAGWSSSLICLEGEKQYFYAQRYYLLLFSIAAMHFLINVILISVNMSAVDDKISKTKFEIVKFCTNMNTDSKL